MAFGPTDRSNSYSILKPEVCLQMIIIITILSSDNAPKNDLQLQRDPLYRALLRIILTW